MVQSSGKESRRSKIKGFFKGGTGHTKADEKVEPKAEAEAAVAKRKVAVPKDNPEHSDQDLSTLKTVDDSKPTSTISANTNTSSQPHGSTSEISLSSRDRNDMLISARNSLWQQAFEKLKKDKPELAQNYEELLRTDAGLQTTDTFSPQSTSAIVRKQQARMVSRQWTYSWLGKTKKVRDTAEKILTTITKVSGIVSAGISAAPPFVSLPWSMATSLVAFAMSDFEAVNSAMEGLEEVTLLLANYSLAEREFLLHPLSKLDYEKSVIGLYTAIFEYQARAAQYFSRNTIKRFGANTATAQSWPDAVDKVRNLERLCQVPIQALGVRLSQARFTGVEDLLSQGMKHIERINHTIASEREQREKILKWVSPIDHLRDHVDIRNTIRDEYLGSGQWLLQDTTEFIPWKQSRKEILLLQGVVGSGKTSVTCIAIQHLLETENVAFFYCSATAYPHDPKRTVHNETSNIFQSILAQCALRPDGNIVSQIEAAFSNSDRQSPAGCDMTLGATISNLKDILQNNNEQMTFIFDALDECKDQGEFLEHLADLMTAAPNLRVFISTRFGIDVKEFFSSYRSLSVGEHNSTDIRSYVNSEIDRRGSRLSPLQAQRLKNGLIQHADGVFRWVELEIDVFLPRTHRQGGRMLSKDVDRRLTRLESSQAPPVERLFEAYTELYKYALGDEDEQTRQYVVKTAMKWVLCSFTQLHADALCYAVSIQPDGTRDEDITADDILAYCSNFLVKVSGDVVKLAHLSVRQFFEERKSDEFSRPQQHFQVAKSCLQRVQSRSAEENSSNTSVFDLLDLFRPKGLQNIQIRDDMSFFNHYTYSYWSMHCRASPKSDELKELLDSPNTRDVFFQELTTLHLMIARGTDLKTPDALGNTVLHRAILDKSVAATELLLRVDSLLEHSELVNVRNRASNTALHLAAMTDRAVAFRSLATAGASFESTIGQDWTPLRLAIILGQSRITDLFGPLRSIIPKSHSQSLLHAAHFFGNTEVVRTLAKAGWSLNDPSNTDSHEESLEAIPNSLKDLDSGVSHRGTSARSRERPRLSVQDGEISSCKFCDLERWLHEWQETVYFSSRDQISEITTLKEAGRLDCKVCSFLLNALENADCNTPFSKVEEVRIRAHFDEGLGELATGRDVLELTFADAHVEVDICIDANGGPNFNYTLFEAQFRESRTCALFFIICSNHVRAANFTIAPVSALKLFNGRNVNSKVTEDNVVGIIRQWHSECNHGDDICATDPQYYPTRLIQIESDVKVRLVKTEELPKEIEKRYVFLSVSWGRGDFLKTRKSNMADWEQGIHIRDLAHTHRDAISICRKLGYRYIWIDAICIVQDDYQEFSYEVVQFASCISGADLVFAASQSAAEGMIPQRNDEAVSVQVCLSEWKETQNTFDLLLREPLRNATAAMNENVITRAWRLQEALLPRRLVLFDKQQLIWSCCKTSKSEGSAVPLVPWFIPFQNLRYSLEHAEYSRSYAHHEIFDYWDSIVEMASRGALTLELDRLAVVRSIMESLKPFVNSYLASSEYCSGIWLADVHANLLWVTAEPYKINRDPGSGTAGKFPSFSWANNQGPISYSLSLGLRKVSVDDFPGSLEILESACSPTSLRIIASTMDVDDSCSNVQQYHFFWDAVAEGSYADTMLAELPGTTLAIVAPWAFCQPVTPTNARWAGLVLKARPGDSGGYLRKGAFLGPFCSDDLSAWNTREFDLF